MNSLPKGWTLKKLTDVVDVHDARRVPVNADERAKRPGPFPYYGANGQAGTIDDYLFDGDFVLLAEDGGYFDDFTRTVAYPTRGKFWVNNHAHILAPRSGMPIEFLVAALNALDWRPYVSGTTRLKLTQGAMARVPFAVPPISEQRRIVAKLGTLQSHSRRAREALNAVPPLLERLRQSILAAAFRGDLTKDWREKHRDVEPASELLKRIRIERRKKWEEAALAKMRAKGKAPADDKWKAKYREPKPVDAAGLPELPEGWCWVSPDQLSAPVPNALTIGPFGSDLKVSDYRDEGVRLVFVRDIRAERFGGEKTRFVTKAKAVLLSRHFVQPGDLLMTKMGDPPGDTAVYPAGIEPAVITADCIKLTPFEALSDGPYLKYCFRSQEVRAQLLEQTAGVAQQKLSLERFRTVVVPLPPRDEQRVLVTRLDALSSVIDDQLERSDMLRHRVNALERAFLGKAFRGELVAQHANEDIVTISDAFANDPSERDAQTKRRRSPASGRENVR